MALYIQHIKHARKDAGQKIVKIWEWIQIKAQRPTMLLYSKREPTGKVTETGTQITSLPQIASLLNLRGADGLCNPLFRAYLYVGPRTVCCVRRRLG